VQIPILTGVYTDSSTDFRTAYPVNMAPVPMPQGISNGYLRPAEGLVSQGAGPGVDRGGIEWRGQCYRVMGPRLVRIAADGRLTDIGDVTSDGKLATFDYSFDYLAIASAGRLYLYNGNTLRQVTDPDLGTVLDVVWVDGYFMTTDGEFLVVTELNDPFAIDPLKYGSAEADPDPVVALLKLRNEVYALNRHTIEVFDNVGGDNFPFARIEGGQIQKGCVGTRACCVFQETIAFLGSGRNEAPGVYLGTNSVARKISTAEIDRVLAEYSEAQLSEVLLEARNDRAHQYLYVHLSDQTLVFDAAATEALQQSAWFILTSSIEGLSRYRARNFVWCYDKWLCGDPGSNGYGYLTTDRADHYGNKVRWQFQTAILYNESRGAVVHSLELVCLPGYAVFGTDPVVTTSYSVDGQNWSQDRRLSLNGFGALNKRAVWHQQGFMRNWRIQRFQGTSDARLPVARLEASVEPLAV
jgi:hypothetical protein